MKDQIVITKNTGICAIAVPLFRIDGSEIIASLKNYCLLMTNGRPIAYVIDVGPHGRTMMNAEFVEKNFHFVGDL